jgi:hypothetical protein
MFDAFGGKTTRQGKGQVDGWFRTVQWNPAETVCPERVQIALLFRRFIRVQF